MRWESLGTDLKLAFPLRRPSFGWVSLIVAAGAALVLSGCGLTVNSEGEEAIDFDERITTALASAQDGGASEAQLEILRDAQVAGIVTLEQARQATFAGIDCIVAGGGYASYFEQVEPSGFVLPNAMTEAPDEKSLEAMEPLIDKCVEQESFWVNNIYQLQPTSQDIRDAYLEQQAPIMRECLESNGYATDPEATALELLWQAHQVWRDTNGAVNCDVGA